jgi:hypothetical protein
VCWYWTVAPRAAKFLVPSPSVLIAGLRLGERRSRTFPQVDFIPIAEAIPLTFSERLFAFVEGIAGERIGLAFLAPSIPFPEINDHIIFAPRLNHHTGSPAHLRADAALRGQVVVLAHAATPKAIRPAGSHHSGGPDIQQFRLGLSSSIARSHIHLGARSRLLFDLGRYAGPIPSFLTRCVSCRECLSWPCGTSSKKCRRILLISKCHICRIMFLGVLEPKA